MQRMFSTRVAVATVAVMLAVAPACRNGNPNNPPREIGTKAPVVEPMARDVMTGEGSPLRVAEAPKPTATATKPESALKAVVPQPVKVASTFRKTRTFEDGATLWENGKGELLVRDENGHEIDRGRVVSREKEPFKIVFKSYNDKGDQLRNIDASGFFGLETIIDVGPKIVPIPRSTR